MNKEYLIAFSSFYKAIYAQEKLNERHIRTTVKKLPPELIKSCGYALYLRNASIQDVQRFLEEWEIVTNGIYLVQNQDGKLVYKKI